MPKKKPLEGKPEVHKDLDGFEMNINEFGEITTNTDIDKLNKFLNKNVEDKKFKGLEEIPYAKPGSDTDDDDDDAEDADDLNEISDEFEEFRQFNDKDFKDEFDFDDKDEKDAYAFDEGKHMYEDLDEEEGGKPKKEEEEEDDFDDEEFLDEMADDFGEEDNYNLDDADFDDKF
ncbi:MAG: hypothetical protein ACHQFW_01345 [Chitinophagales bacterium]